MPDDNTEVIEPVVPTVVTPVVEPLVVPPVIAPIVPDVVVPVPAVLPKPEPTGSAYFDAMQDALHEKGIDHSKYSQEIANGGKITPESRAELVGKLGEAQVKLMEHGVTEELSRIKTSQAVEAQKVYDAVALPGFTDGKAGFEVLVDWSKTDLTDEERASYNSMLSKGGVQANLAVKAIKERYMSDPNYTTPANLVTGDLPAGAVGVELISRSTYVTELRKAENARDKATVLKLNERAKHTMATNPAVWRP